MTYIWRHIRLVSFSAQEWEQIYRDREKQQESLA